MTERVQVEVVAHRGLLAMPCQAREREGSRGDRTRPGAMLGEQEKSKWATVVDMLQKPRHGHEINSGLQGARRNARKKPFVENDQTKIWVRCPKYLESTSAICLQKEQVLLKFTKCGDL